MAFRSYIHVERLGKPEVEGILNGKCYIQPKLDGTNGSVWADEDGTIHCGSRTREVSIYDDNAGFAAHMLSDDPQATALRTIAKAYYNLVFYGEWLVKTKLGKHYLNRNCFYIFDVYNRDTGKYLPFEDYAQILAQMGYEYIVPTFEVVENPDPDHLVKLADNNHFNLPPDVVGEGVVIKNYDYVSQWGNYEVAKIVRAEFMADKGKAKVPQGSQTEGVEKTIVDEYVTAADVDKCKDKTVVALDIDEFDIKKYPRCIPMVMEMAWKDLIEEELYNILKKMKNPTINFTTLRQECNQYVRQCLGLI